MHAWFRIGWVFLLTWSAHTQTMPDTSVGGALRSLASRAAVVFIGQVVKIEPNSGVVEVTFRVDQAVQGAVGETYLLREWAGLWVNGQPRYLPGERAMVFLRPPGVGGLSTPVDGMEGVVPVMVTSADQAPTLDVRRLATRVQRPVGEPLVSAVVLVSDAVAAVNSSQEPVLRKLSAATKQVPRVPVRLTQEAGGYVR